MKKTIYLFLASLLLNACVREVLVPPAGPSEDGLVEKTWTVRFGDGTRATLDEDLYPVWEVGERLSVYDPTIGSGRVFTVSEVNGHSAVITGRISDGVTLFDAIYPSKSAGAWAPDGTNRAKLPAVQSIPAGRNICPDVLVSTAHSDHPEESILFHNAVSLLRFRLDRSDLSTVRFDLDGAVPQSYTVASEEGPFSPGEYYLAVDPGTYSGVRVTCETGFDFEYSKSSTRTLEASQGGLLHLGLVSDGARKRAYAVTGEKAYASLQALIDETGIFSGLTGLLQIFANAMVNSAFPERSQAVRAFNLTHPSADPQGRPVTLSARVYVPESALDGTKPLEGIAIANHGTIASNAECPTMSGDFEAMFAWRNYAIVMPDYYGFGASQDRPQAFLDWETTARGSLDAYFATLQLLQDRDVTAGPVRFNYGYSQGGFNTIANLRYLAEHPDLDLSFTKSFAGGGPFDVPQTWDSYLTGSFSNAIGFIPLTLVSMNESQQLGLDYATLFKGTLLANWREWILTKKYSLGTINSKIGSAKIPDILTEDLVAGQGPSYAAIMGTAARYSLTSGWKPASGNRIYLSHSTQDDIVPYANYTKMKSFLERAATDCELHWSNLSGDHVTACIYFIINTSGEWNTR
ncbi:MAG: hypothetical protein IJ654_06870 [Bacteroidales bacterium]|nr:hypothetical protein [Bacteroidales bacterium]